MPDPLDWRAILSPVVQLMADEEAHMDALAERRPEMVKLLCERMRRAADAEIARRWEGIWTQGSC